MSKFTFKTAAISICLLLPAVAQATVSLDPTDLNNKLDAIVELPIKNLKAVEAGGEIYYMSDNGRFVLKGQLYDILYKKPLDTMSQIEDSATRLHFDEMGANPDDYNTLTIGSGEKTVIGFVDPLCPICHKIMNDSKALGDKYTFKFIVVPALGKESNVLSKRVFCAKDRQGAIDAFIGEAMNTVAQKEKCDTKEYDMTLMMAHIIGVEGVPMLVAPDGRISKGRPSDLSNWLKGN